ncbi:tetratricopeptide repeat protein [Streptomyces cellulosae]|uniref:Tetratricopeptide repeat protein n=1 Tax=Streptomyces cellulosae TaxID=1968 RepID=A0ABW7Y407_STRCE
MTSTRPSMQELIGRRKRAGFVGRRDEIDRFRNNFDVPPEDERHSFVFHVHGTAGVGKSSLVREFEAVAAARGAVTATTDETVNSVPETMAAISSQFTRQGVELKALDKMLATYWQRRHEAETASVAPEPGPGAGAPSAGSVVMAQAGLVGLGMVPGVGAFTGAIDPAQVAQGTDRIRAALSARFRSHDEVQLVLEPLRVLTPVFVEELNRVAEKWPWIALFFDTYERTSPFLDPWLLEVTTTGRYGTLPGNVVVTLAGQHGPDAARWGDYAGFVTEFAMEPFTEAETRQLLAAKGVVDEQVVREVLRLSNNLPVLVSTLAVQPGDEPGPLDDPAATAVERFLRWERDPDRREAALACSFPRRLDEDVFHATVDGEVRDSYTWLRGLPFVSERAGRVLYHDVVRTAMLRLQRTRSPRKWTERHARLAEAYGRWRAEAENGLDPDSLWFDRDWRELRTEESYHELCARPRVGLGQALRDVVEACRADTVAARGCAQALYDAGDQSGAEEVRTWGHDLLAVLSEESDTVLPALGLLLDRAGLDAPTRAEAHSVRGRELRQAKEYRQALVECDRAVALDPQSAKAYYGRGVTHALLGDHTAALTDLQRADELRPDTPWIILERGEALQALGRHEEAVTAFDRVLVLEPTEDIAWADRAYSKHALGDDEGALADFSRALEIDTEYLWALVHRAEVLRAMGRLDEAFADLDRAVGIAPESAWIASERGDVYRMVGRYEEAVTELGRALSLIPDYASVLAGRGAALHELDRNEEALADLDRAVELAPDYGWALVKRSWTKLSLLDPDGMIEDLRRAVEAEPDVHLISAELGMAYRLMGRYDEAIPVFHRILERDPDYDIALAGLGAIHRVRNAYEEALRYLDRAVTSYPAYAWAYGQRARLCLAIGRSEQALADLDRCCALDPEEDWEGGAAIELLMWCGRWEEAAARLADADRAATPDDGLDRLRVRMHRHTGQWDEARRIAERLREAEPFDGTLELAMTVGRSEGLRVAEPLWREVARSLEEDDEIEDMVRAEGRCLIGCALADWAEADRGLTEFLATDPGWDDLSLLADTLTELLQSPDANRTRLASCLTAVTTARDAVQARYAE